MYEHVPAIIAATDAVASRFLQRLAEEPFLGSLAERSVFGMCRRVCIVEKEQALRAYR